MEGDKYPRTVKGLKQFFYKIRKSRNDLMMAIVLKKNNRHIGNIKLGTINWFHCFGDLGIMIGEKSCWNKGYGQEACRLFLGYAFNKLKMHKVTLGVHAQHLAAIRAYSKVGFRKEGRISGLWRWGRKFEDKILMGISKSGLR
jgi:RimJ/RimL family protein N-acetyltransferase